MRILFVASLHHPQELQTAWEQTPPNEIKPLFPPSMGQHHWEQALRQRGHELSVFYRNLPGWGGDITQLGEQTYTQGITPQRAYLALMNRMPPRYNLDKRARNQRLIEHAHQFKPDVVWLVGDNTVIYSETLSHLKHTLGCKIVYASGTSPIVFSHAIEREAARLYDLVLVNDFYHGVQWEELGATHVVTLPIAAIDPAFHHPYSVTEAERQRFSCDIAFVGTLLPVNLYSRRIQALEALREFDLGIWSVHAVPDSLKPYVRGRALGAEMLKIMSCAKVVINVHGDFMRYGGNMRLFEVASLGVCQIADDLAGVRRWFTPDENILVYASVDDLKAQVRAILADNTRRMQIAQNGQQHVYAHHTYAQRARAFEEALGL